MKIVAKVEGVNRHEFKIALVKTVLGSLAGFIAQEMVKKAVDRTIDTSSTNVEVQK